ncbi:hypothetical protein IG631_03277 [Alternaria alternata]|nr:hypothetical protein IG631_03277 [Alternaria alternata]
MKTGSRARSWGEGDTIDEGLLGCAMLCCMRKENSRFSRRRHLAHGRAQLDWEGRTSRHGAKPKSPQLLLGAPTPQS